jgi:1-aminocyclopropane-1-carboxylate deaminase/D-cysteine desulfhydrase-like pyridoxal-dependent ACC family enzyme
MGCRRQPPARRRPWLARTEALFVDHTYTAKAMAGLIAACRDGRFRARTVLFWHTGGQVGLFA